ncbi:MAG TPA: hypothetical protein VGE97_09045 [Nitrososphaera sp.]
MPYNSVGSKPSWCSTNLFKIGCLHKFLRTTSINAGSHSIYCEYLMRRRSGLGYYILKLDIELLEGNDKALGYVAATNNLMAANVNKIQEHSLKKSSRCNS